jgi:16S rRNA (guanine1207-N2)-methyltransferase
MSRFHHQGDAALEAILQVLESEPELAPSHGKIAFLHARPHQGLNRLRGQLVCHNDFKPTADMLETAGFKNEASLEGKFPLVLLLPDRQKLQTLADFAQAFELLEDDGVLLVGLHNDWGAKRFEKHLHQVSGGKLGTLSKFHCRAFWARKTGKIDVALLQDWKMHGEWQKVVDDRFWSKPGLFSWDKIDGGSRFLIEHLPGNLQGRVADLGAGWGFLSDFVLRKYPAVHGLDVFEADRVAIEACRKNLDAIKTKTRLSYHWADVAVGVADKKFDFIVCNPPFHEDRSPDPELGILFVGAAARALKTGGELWLVANRHLPYERVMSGIFPESSIVVQDGSYKVLRGVKKNVAVGEEELVREEPQAKVPEGANLRRRRP